ncbi:multivesicular body subunit 12A isoform X2 [Cylas formicarius]|uniref:multivesicular body subunit 12A isoform X2 n=1 Tax=Cylas formicarius TaxID=197179 RepID=UPI002958B836|nr:multivesicular body subunit 12A isoform X2 [Cylas formicarius]
MLKSSVQSRILKTLPNDRPITAIQIVENLEKCPRGFYPISRTYDQDSDADLGESSIFKSSTSRYLCLSKTEGIPNFVVQEIIIVNQGTNPPKGFSLLNRTADSSQKAWKKKQICYRLVNQQDLKIAITDIIVCSRLKKAPSGFLLAGDLNGITLCYKMGNVQDSQANDANPAPPERPPKPFLPQGPLYPPLGGNEHDYEILKPGGGPAGPVRPAPRPPAPVPPVMPYQNSTHTLGYSSYYGLEGVPFVINPKLLESSNGTKGLTIRTKTMHQIIKEYDYPFTVERESH